MYDPVWKRPSSVDEALEALDVPPGSSMAVAGGTDLAVLMDKGALRPDFLVDITGIEEMSGIGSAVAASGELVTVGALATHSLLASDEGTAGAAEVLSVAAGTVGSRQIRSRGTIGGNLANASPAADGSVALLALDATVEIASAGDGGSHREIRLAEFFVGPGETALGHGELLTRVSFPVPPAGTRSAYLKLGQRNALAIAVVSVGLAYEPDAGRVSIALGSVAPTPVRATEAERLFEAEWPHSTRPEELIDEVAAAAASSSCPIDDVRGSAAYRRRMVGVLTRRGLRRVCL